MSDQHDYIFFAKKGIPLNDAVKETLSNNGTNKLFIQENDLESYFNYINDGLRNLVKNPNIDSKTKAEAVQASCKAIMKKVYDDPRALFINSACNMIVPTVDLILSNDQATRHLVQLTAYDHYTYVHSTNVGIFSIALARIFYGANSSHDMQKLGLGFFLHDLGKCKIPLEILNKPGPLTPEERLVVNRHPADGGNLLRECGYATEEAEIIILQHHERDDGSGYPAGLKGSDVHPYARICRIADVYEALTSERPYHKRHTTFEALKVIKEQMVDLDKELINCFIQLFV
jgi:HD-GYP domain-containing protein (c-di-GMP phosphodiesterase class II)